MDGGYSWQNGQLYNYQWQPMSGFASVTPITRNEIKKEDINKVQEIGELVNITGTVVVDMTNGRPVDLFTIQGTASNLIAMVNNPAPTSPVTKEFWIYPYNDISITFPDNSIIPVGDIPANLQAGKTHVFVCRQNPNNSTNIIMNYSYSF
jgi:hypothetical protein